MKALSALALCLLTACSSEPGLPAAPPAPGGPDRSSPARVLDAYFAAAQKADKAALFALMTAECQAKEDAAPRSFTNAWCKMGVTIKSFTQAKLAEEGDKASAHYKTILAVPGEKEDGEPIRFQLVKKGGQWWIEDVG